MRKALIVGIDYYKQISPLKGCVRDALDVSAMLERHADGTINFTTPYLLTATSPDNALEKGRLKDATRELFKDDSEIALFYFSGHGYIEDIGGYLCTSECRTGDDGLAFSELMSLANASKAKNTVVVLDCCHSGSIGTRSDRSTSIELREGMTILTASTANQYAVESGGSGLFTSLLVDALNGGAANLVGDITPGSVYAHIDQSLGPWKQRPVFRTNVRTFVSLRRADPPIPPAELRLIAKYFPSADSKISLDPSYEPERSPEQKIDPNIPPPDPGKNAVFRTLQNYARVNLVRPVGVDHMWHAAMQSKACELTLLGKHYHKLVADGLM